jgi:uncharacterized protein YndB with AHSA1/START domain
MSSAPMIPAIQATLTVGVPVERAFRVFTESLNTWWPAEYHIGSAATDAAILEPREGGRWYERGVDGSECDWSRVLAWQPPHCLVVTWQINGLWQFHPKPDHASEIEVHFRADGPELTTVELEHRLLDRLVDGSAKQYMRRSSAAAAGSPCSNYSPRQQPTPSSPTRQPTPIEPPTSGGRTFSRSARSSSTSR